MATEIDPVCGMEVDSATSDLSLAWNGTTWWFCGKGCMLEFRDDPEAYRSPDQVPSIDPRTGQSSDLGRTIV